MNSNVRIIVYGVVVLCLLIIAYNLVTFEETGEVVEEVMKEDQVEEIEQKSDKAEIKTEPEAAPSVSPKKDEYGKWIVDRSADEFNGKQNITAAVESENITKAWLDTTRPAFIIRCLENKTEVLLNTRHQFEVEQGHTEEVKINFTIDDGQPVSEYWKRGPEGKTAFAHDPEPLAKKLSGAKVLRIEFTPFNADAATAAFDIEKSEKVIDEILKACNQ